MKSLSQEPLEIELQHLILTLHPYQRDRSFTYTIFGENILRKASEKTNI